MSVKRFFGANSREAMQQVRASLGDDALILANRPVDGGVEVLALADEAATSMTEQAVAAEAMQPAVRRQGVAEPEPARRDSYSGVVSATPPAADAPAASSAASSAPPEDFAALSQQLLGEMQEMRELLGHQDAGRAGPSAELHWQLLAAGIGHALAGELLAGRPAELADAPADQARAWLERQLAARLKVAPRAEALLDEGGVLALVGPTGVGKTTTTAKLAARYVMRHGPERVVLVTTDAYRIGAQDQLRIYAELMGVEMHALEADRPLESLLPQLVDKHLVLVDTVGMSQRDRRLLEQIAHLRGDSRAVRLVLLLNAASQGETIDEVVTTYLKTARAMGGRLEDAILTKQDEAARLGGALDTLIRHGLTLHFVSHGQRVPEDLAVADGAALIGEALEVGGASPFASPRGIEPPSGGSPGGAALFGQARAMGALWRLLDERVPGFGTLADAWALGSLPSRLQGERLAPLYERVPMTSTSLLWARASTLPGEDWMLPHLALDATGRPLAQPFPEHRLVAGQGERMAWAETTLGVSAHLLPRLPDARLRAWLEARGSGWLSQAQANSRVRYRGERLALSALVTEARALPPVSLRYRGQTVSVSIARLAVRCTGPGEGEPMWAWFAEVHGQDSGAVLTRRYAMSPAWWPAERGRSALLEQLAADELPTLARHAARELAGTGPLAIDGELRTFMAGGIAALAMHLEQAEDDWAMDARAQLLRLAGGRRPRRARTLLDGLIQVLEAREAMRHFAEQEAW
ncbi:flagellar biosynthesis protein FlhF [Halomonas sp. YLGW01]|uniref:flagellar biosynthesis protein FlhF n=1 Tax=Halomonas sp. YLGW01 TaxID=2773308 RepID=UPI00177C32C5|nr:flagellar biosynthesis protein FlhF [Halomonas sp. YLGW01]